VQEPVAEIRGVTKDYGPVRALAGVDLDLHRGEVHGLLGANGAGKSTLVKILAGLQTPTSGTVRIGGAPYAGGSVAASIGAGIRVAHQELAVVPTLTVAQNLALGGRLHATPPKERQRAFAALFEEWGLRVSMSTVMRELSPALQAAVSLSRALVGDPRLLVLDEPTASLGPVEVSGLFGIVRRRVQEGAAVVFVSHRLKEVSELCDVVTVLRNGAKVHTGPANGLAEHEIAELIAPSGREPRASAEPRPARAVPAPGAATATPVLSIRDLELQSAVRSASLEVGPGEVVGLAGLVGAGRTELLEALMGMRRIVSGTVEVDGRPFAPSDPHAAISRGVVLVPEERASQAVFPERDIVFNASSSRFRELGRGWGGFLSGGTRYVDSTRALTGALRLKAGSLKDPILSLSGGNQQKVVLARTMSDGLRLLLLDEPTRGVDVGARRDFQRVVRELAERGVGVVYVSSELGELAHCDRVVVIVEGRTTTTFPTGDGFDEDALTRACFLHLPVGAGTT
jgi:ABC-type sugar transport system ATPase subunit